MVKEKDQVREPKHNDENRAILNVKQLHPVSFESGVSPHNNLSKLAYGVDGKSSKDTQATLTNTETLSSEEDDCRHSFPSNSVSQSSTSLLSLPLLANSSEASTTYCEQREGRNEHSTPYDLDDDEPDIEVREVPAQQRHRLTDSRRQQLVSSSPSTDICRDALTYKSPSWTSSASSEIPKSSSPQGEAHRRSTLGSAGIHVLEDINTASESSSWDGASSAAARQKSLLDEVVAPVANKTLSTQSHVTGGSRTESSRSTSKHPNHTDRYNMNTSSSSSNDSHTASNNGSTPSSAVRQSESWSSWQPSGVFSSFSLHWPSGDAPFPNFGKNVWTPSHQPQPPVRTAKVCKKKRLPVSPKQPREQINRSSSSSSSYNTDSYLASEDDRYDSRSLGDSATDDDNNTHSSDDENNTITDEDEEEEHFNNYFTSLVSRLRMPGDEID